MRAVTQIVNLLVDGGAARIDDDGAIHDGQLTPDRAVRLVEEAVERRQRIDESRLAMIRGYAETARCRRA